MARREATFCDVCNRLIEESDYALRGGQAEASFTSLGGKPQRGRALVVTVRDVYQCPPEVKGISHDRPADLCDTCFRYILECNEGDKDSDEDEDEDEEPIEYEEEVRRPKVIKKSKRGRS